MSNTLPLQPPLHRGPFQYRALSQPLRTIRHPSSSIPSRPLPRPADRVRDETRRGRARGEATRHGTHGTGQTPTCGLRRRSSRHHHIPPNLGKASCLHHRDSCRESSIGCPGGRPLARPCISLDKLFLILAHPTYQVPTQFRDPVQSAVPAAPGVYPPWYPYCAVAGQHGWVRLSGHNCAAALHCVLQYMFPTFLGPSPTLLALPGLPDCQTAQLRHPCIRLHPTLDVNSSRSLDPCLPYELANHPPPGATNQHPGAFGAQGGFASLKPLLHSGHSLP